MGTSVRVSEVPPCKIVRDSLLSLPSMDYSKEAKKLWARLGIDPNQVNEGKGYNLVDPIFKSPEGGCIYVGGERAARDLDLLREKKITTVVNCTDDIRFDLL